MNLGGNQQDWHEKSLIEIIKLCYIFWKTLAKEIF